MFVSWVMVGHTLPAYKQPVNVFASLHCVIFCITSFLLSFGFEIIWCLCHNHVKEPFISFVLTIKWILGWIAWRKYDAFVEQYTLECCWRWIVSRNSSINSCDSKPLKALSHTVNLGIKTLYCPNPKLRHSSHRFNQDLLATLLWWYHFNTIDMSERFEINERWVHW